MTAQPGRRQAGRRLTDREILSSYTDQPDILPQALRREIEAAWGGAAIELYALADLDESLNLAQVWVALGPGHIALVQAPDSANAPAVTLIARGDLGAVTERPGLSCTVLTLLGRSEDVLAVLRYSHRQRRAMEAIRFVLEQQLAGHLVEGGAPDDFYASAVAKPLRDAQASVAGQRLAVAWRLLSYLLPYRRQLALGMLAASFMTALALLPPYVTKYLLDDVVQPFADGGMSRESALTVGWIVIAALALSYLLREACLWLRLRIMSVLGEYVAHDLRRELYAHLQKLSLSFYSSKQTGSIISRVSHDTDRLWDFIAFGVVEVSLSVIMLLGLSVVLISLDWRLGLVMTLPVPLLLGAFALHSRTMNRVFLRAWRKWSGVTEVLADTVPGMRVVKAFNQEAREVTRFNDRNGAALSGFNDVHQVWTKFWPRLMLGLHAMVLAVWVLAMPRMLLDPAAPGHLSFGTFMAFLLYIGMFMYPIETIGMVTRMMNRATSSALRIFEILDTEPEIREPLDPVRLTPLKGQVSFENVTFAYDGIRQVLKNLSFEVAPGEMIGLVGPSGSGKTSVINLIARFYDPTGGRVLIDGVDLRDLDAGHYRQQVGMVLQDPHLFQGRVLENIAYGCPGASLDRILAAAKAANAHDFICRLPQGYDTIVGERGHTLSGGERQRISIARAVLNDPRILILDEATSSVDTETESKIQEALDRLFEGRTVFAIAHRLSTLRRASRLFVMENGKLVEEGDHEALLSNEKGIYRRLSDLQRMLHEGFGV